MGGVKRRTRQGRRSRRRIEPKLKHTCTIATSIPLASNFSVSRNCERPGTSDSGTTRGTGPPPGGGTIGGDAAAATTTLRADVVEEPRPRWPLRRSGDRSSDDAGVSVRREATGLRAPVGREGLGEARTALPPVDDAAAAAKALIETAIGFAIASTGPAGRESVRNCDARECGTNAFFAHTARGALEKGVVRERERETLVQALLRFVSHTFFPPGVLSFYLLSPFVWSWCLEFTRPR